MKISVNGESQVPPGFRFHPTEEELLQYYLRKKICYEKIDLDVIRDVDLNKLEPWDIQEKCKIGSTLQNDWYFFSHKDKKYPTGTRTNRATTVGFWKATGRDKVIHSNARKRIGMRKTLVFYTGRAPNAKKSDWIMHEYRLDDNITTTYSTNILQVDEVGWVVCRVFKKKSHLKSTERPSTSSVAIESTGFDSCDDGTLEQVLEKIGKGYKEEEIKLPSLDSPKYRTMSKENQENTHEYHPIIPVNMATESSEELLRMGVMNWETLDQLVASQLNSQTEAEASYNELCCFCNDPTVGYCLTCSSSSSIATTHTIPATHDIDLWNFVPSTTSQPLTVPPVNTSNLTL